ncbi:MULTISPECIES: UDP-N-acetylmuramoyl-L-alanyl-D-glutamate--2,6-diaminopimelate ligase [Rhodomicrobium]|uniref:UDP-N-acetylmuramoyl-L-alanyl-D-glutamate--2, 6-diaminopimelate ligase n=1 Tax=Rhodomicrobium TaxID=1068 RepID=UPI000B4AD7F9|nr:MULTISPECIES: UDP-N-acetylmuramoyl-L-alanyl-D-glutamate--2,6-diaminopimelate ligase [Rhodomicrobium]
MKLKDLCAATGDARPVTGLTADSREVEPGYVFAALAGTKTDGARFITDALARGATAILAGEGVPVDAPDGVIVIRDANPRRRLALMAARFHGRQPETAAAVTGTNGKTSVASFLRQLWEANGFAAASLGTTGVSFQGVEIPLHHTTPDPVSLHASLADLAARGATHLAFEASSHGLAQYRADGIKLAAGGFTNISRDHLDYHPDFADYFRAKMRLFTELLAPGQPAVIDVDSEAGDEAAEIARARGLQLITTGRRGDTLRLVSTARDGFGQRLGIVHERKVHEVRIPLAGDFQASNVLVALGLALATGVPLDAAFAAAEKLKGAKGRLELAGYAPAGGPVFIDYAHTPDALENAIAALRPYVAGRLHVVFGCGGDRDKGKRPQMGEVAARFADRVTVTDDNPRSEDPAEIRAEILAAAPGAIEIGDRQTAIAAAIGSMAAGDLLLVAGKGHETGQIVGNTVIPYSDHDAVAALLGVPDQQGTMHG